MGDPFDGWAIIELLGRTRIAGHATADAPLLQATRFLVDIYDGDAETPAATQLVFVPVWRITACTEALARRLGADALRGSMPVAQWELPPPAAAPAAITGPGEDDDVHVLHALGCADEDCLGECDG